MMRKILTILALFPISLFGQDITGFNIINANTNLTERTLNNGDTIDINILTDFSIQAVTNPITVGSVVFTLTGPVAQNQTESTAPYALFGDNAGNYNAWTNVQPGTYSLNGLAYSQSGGNGTTGSPLNVTFVIIDGRDTTGTMDTSGASSNVSISGELKTWHRVALTFEGPNLCENSQTNPFTAYRLIVTFTNGQTVYQVPGFYAADGNAAESSATCGNKWRVYFSPDEIGTWSYAVSFRTGNNIAINDAAQAGTPVSPLDGVAGTINISNTNKTGKDFRGKGMLKYVGQHYLQFAGTGEYYLKGGADSPENFLGYFEFDQTTDQGGVNTPGLVNGLHRYAPHVQDWNQGDPSWKNGKGKGIIGALNYLSSKGGNSVYFLTYNLDNGDGRDTWVWNDVNERYRFDVSKLDQWEIVFSHMDKLGIQLHVITQETENNNSLGGNGQLNDIRKLYYRELVARFSHHLAVQWNLGEENTNSDAEKASFAQYIRNQDSYNHPINVHTQYGNANSFYAGLMNNNSYRPYFEATSIQGNASSYNDWAIGLRNSSANAGRKWVIYGDEQGPAVNPSGANLGTLRKDALWGNLMGGGGGIEYYFGYQNTFGDVQSEDWRIVEGLWEQNAYARDFFQMYLPFYEMEPDNNLIDAGSSDFCFAKAGEIYAAYLKFGGGGGNIRLNINTTGNYSVKWYNPRTGGGLQNGSVTTLQVLGAGWQNLGNPPVSGANDWVVLVSNTSILSSSITQRNVSCSGGADGFAKVNITGGTLPYTYSWSNNSTNDSIANVGVGTYTVTITDAALSTTTNSVTITEPLPISIVGNVTDESVNGNDGAITLTVSGGTSTYNYSWSNNSTTKDLSALAANNYTVTITDANSCSSVKLFTVGSSPIPMSSVINSSNVSCNDGTDGFAKVSVTGGTLPYTYSWSNNSTNDSIVNVAAGIYAVTITDAAQSTTTNSITITEPLPISIVGNVTDESVNGNDGSITFTVSGGTTGYFYQWSNGAMTKDIVALIGDNYGATVTDNNDCSLAESYIVGSTSALLRSTVNFSNVSCNGGSDGFAMVSVTGGNPPYAYIWSNADITDSITNIEAGIYAVTVTDAMQSTVSNTITIAEPSSLIVVGNVIDESVNGNDGSIVLSVSGGTPAYRYQWSNGDTTKNIIMLVANTYSVTVTDNNDCLMSESFIVEKDTIPTGLVTLNNLSVTIFPNPTNDIVSVLFDSNQQRTVNFSIADLTGKELIISQAVLVGQETIQFNLADFPSGIYFLSIRFGEQRLVRKIMKF